MDTGMFTLTVIQFENSFASLIPRKRVGSVMLVINVQFIHWYQLVDVPVFLPPKLLNLALPKVLHIRCALNQYPEREAGLSYL